MKKGGSIVDAEYLGCFNIENMMVQINIQDLQKNRNLSCDIDHEYKCYY